MPRRDRLRNVLTEVTRARGGRLIPGARGPAVDAELTSDAIWEQVVPREIAEFSAGLGALSAQVDRLRSTLDRGADQLAGFQGQEQWLGDVREVLDQIRDFVPGLKRWFDADIEEAYRQVGPVRERSREVG